MRPFAHLASLGAALLRLVSPALTMLGGAARRTATPGRRKRLRLVDTGEVRTVIHGRRHAHRLTGRTIEPKRVAIRIHTHVWG